MARAKGSRSQYISAGVHKNVSTSTKRMVRSDYMASNDRIMNQQRALHAGKDIVVTVPNPNKEETNRLFIKTRISGRDFLKASVA